MFEYKPYNFDFIIFVVFTFFTVLYFFVYLLKITTTVGFEPTRPMGNALAGHRVNHSAKLPNNIYSILLTFLWCIYVESSYISCVSVLIICLCITSNGML